ncbi:hypothetical protein Bxe_A1746 [Paraburkholderia xenovorans LB400]|uniref:Uncharacterized protein n=1 Tax=Paraburkholderia xenovorans (strain LB400) TaxID=266265 RepID=Q13XH8_PARXL|nr:hypothetical protein Bxe_A1746 [Paraburkholderia xenovorans LB400]
MFSAWRSSLAVRKKQSPDGQDCRRTKHTDDSVLATRFRTSRKAIVAGLRLGIGTTCPDRVDRHHPHAGSNAANTGMALRSLHPCDFAPQSAREDFSA